MSGLENEDRQPSNLTVNDGEKVGDGGEGARGRRPSPKRWATGRTTSSNQ